MLLQIDLQGLHQTNDRLISCKSLPSRWTCPLQCVSVDRLLLGMMMLIRNVSYAERKEGESFGGWSTGTSFPFPERWHESTPKGVYFQMPYQRLLGLITMKITSPMHYLPTRCLWCVPIRECINFNSFPHVSSLPLDDVSLWTVNRLIRFFSLASASNLIPPTPLHYKRGSPSLQYPHLPPMNICSHFTSPSRHKVIWNVGSKIQTPPSRSTIIRGLTATSS